MWYLCVFCALCAAAACLYIQLDQAAESADGSLLSKLRPINNKYIIWYGITFAFCISVMMMLMLFYQADGIYTAKRVFLLALLSPIAVSDYKTLKIPNKLILVGLIGRVAFIIPELLWVEDWLSVLIDCAVAAAIGIVICLICYLISRGSFGMGDVKLIAVIGLILGTQGLGYTVFCSAIISFFTALILLITKKKKKNDALPFAPFIFCGAFLSFILSGT